MERWVQSGLDGTGYRAWDGALVVVVPDWVHEEEDFAWGVHRNLVSFVRGAHTQASILAPGASWGVCGQIRGVGDRGRGSTHHVIDPAFPSAATEIYLGMEVADLRIDGVEVEDQTVGTVPFPVSVASDTPFPTDHGCRYSPATRSPSHHRPSPARDALQTHRIQVQVWVWIQEPG